MDQLVSHLDQLVSQLQVFCLGFQVCSGLCTLNGEIIKKLSILTIRYALVGYVLGEQ